MAAGQCWNRAAEAISCSWPGFRPAPGPKQDEPRTVRLQLTPDAGTLPLGGSQPLLKIIAHSSDGSQRIVTWLTKFDSNDMGLVSVTPQGVVKAERHGETAIRAAFDGQVAVGAFLPSRLKIKRSPPGTPPRTI